MDLSYLHSLSEGIPKHEILQELMKSYGKDVWKFAYSLTGRRDLADDIRQDVFVKAFTKMETFRGHSTPKTWLLSITRNSVRDYRKSAFFRKVLLVDFIPVNEVHDSAEKDYFKRQEMTEAWKAVLRLPVKLREVLILHAHYQLSIAEMASMLDLTESAVKVRLHRARNKANIILAEDAGDQDGVRKN